MINKQLFQDQFDLEDKGQGHKVSNSSKTFTKHGYHVQKKSHRRPRQLQNQNECLPSFFFFWGGGGEGGNA